MDKIKCIFFTSIVSPHQLPWAREFEKLLEGRFIYVANELECSGRRELGWKVDEIPEWVITPDSDQAWRSAIDQLDKVEILITGIRDIKLFERRLQKGLQTYYTSERWFKPPLGIFRLLMPKYFLMCLRFTRLLKHSIDSHARYTKYFYLLPIGIHAARDMARLFGLFEGDLRCLIKSPLVQMTDQSPVSKFELQRTAKIRISCKNGENTDPANELIAFENLNKYRLNQMRLWGYFVEGSIHSRNRSNNSCKVAISSNNTEQSLMVKHDPIISILWVGRMLDWKRVDTLITAVLQLLEEGQNINLKIVGMGPQSRHLYRLAKKWVIDVPQVKNERGRALITKGVYFSPPVHINEVRNLMQEADIYILSSDGGEGWGAVVNEAMSEGCCVIGTNEAGSSATMIKDGVNGYLYNARNSAQLINIIRSLDSEKIFRTGKNAQKTIMETWSPCAGSQRLLEWLNMNEVSGHFV